MFSISFILAIIFSCQELYEAPLEKNQNKFLVVEGRISNTGSSVKVRLTNAIGFNDDESKYNSSVETKAQVSISDDQGITANLQETGNGYYEVYNYTGFVGRTYTLKIKTADGLIYESTAETMQPSSDNVSLIAEFATKDVEEINGSGETQFVAQNGVNIYVDVKTSQGARAFYKFDTRIITQIIHVEWRYGRCALCNPTYVYCWKVGRLDQMPSVKESIITNGVGVIKHYNLGFIQQAFYDDKYGVTEVKDAPRTFGWLLTCNVSCISEKEFLYYSKLRDQLSADSKIFDPLPTQLLSNIKCVTDYSKVVLGYFSAWPQLTKDYYVKYNYGDKDIYQRNVSGSPEYIYPDCADNIPPVFWQQLPPK